MIIHTLESKTIKKGVLLFSFHPSQNPCTENPCTDLRILGGLVLKRTKPSSQTIADQMAERFVFKKPIALRYSSSSVIIWTLDSFSALMVRHRSSFLFCTTHAKWLFSSYFKRLLMTGKTENVSISFLEMSNLA